MRYFVTIDQNGVPTNFYTVSNSVSTTNSTGKVTSSETIPSDVPNSAIEIDYPTYQSLGSGRYAFVDGALVAYTPPPNYLSSSQIDNERDRRCYGGFIYNGKAYQTDSTSIANILGSAQLAFMAIVAGAQSGNLRWANPNLDFSYISSDNTSVPMDAQTVVDLAKNAATFRSMIIYAGRNLKNALAAGQTPDIYADTSWGVDYTSPTSTYRTDPSGSPGSPIGPTGPASTIQGTTGATGPTGPTSS